MLYASFAFYYFNLRSLNRLLTFVSLFLRSIFTFFFLLCFIFARNSKHAYCIVYIASILGQPMQLSVFHFNISPLFLPAFRFYVLRRHISLVLYFFLSRSRYMITPWVITGARLGNGKTTRETRLAHATNENCKGRSGSPIAFCTDPIAKIYLHGHAFW